MNYEFEMMLEQAMSGQPVYRDSTEAPDHVTQIRIVHLLITGLLAEYARQSPQNQALMREGLAAVRGSVHANEDERLAARIVHARIMDTIEADEATNLERAA